MQAAGSTLPLGTTALIITTCDILAKGILKPSHVLNCCMRRSFLSMATPALLQKVLAPHGMWRVGGLDREPAVDKGRLERCFQPSAQIAAAAKMLGAPTAASAVGATRKGYGICMELTRGGAPLWCAFCGLLGIYHKYWTLLGDRNVLPATSDDRGMYECSLTMNVLTHIHLQFLDRQPVVPGLSLYILTLYRQRP